MRVFTGQGDPTEANEPLGHELLKRAIKRKGLIKAITRAARKLGIPRKLARNIAKRKAAAL